MPCTQIDKARKYAMPEWGNLLQALGFQLASENATEMLWTPTESLSLLRLDREALGKACPMGMGAQSLSDDRPSGASGLLSGRASKHLTRFAHLLMQAGRRSSCPARPCLWCRMRACSTGVRR